MTFIWATRGLIWGFRFLRDGGCEEPLRAYDDSFSELWDESEVCRRLSGKVALRFPDPLGRRDRAGRIIPHDFVVFEPLAHEVESVEDGIRLVWPLVADEFVRVWQLSMPPSPSE
ncbi:hypothetical protein [Arthrobacter dokdonensis]|uniref:hypothetical protein n=1 Tax=Arthrobacter dokdonellae TaxID=2211210 RepID=UPI000DE5BEAF|nr:hypothetical protein [Arthrobacter dokdonellae]